jgi:hypothetical protein
VLLKRRPGGAVAPGKPTGRVGGITTPYGVPTVLTEVKLAKICRE